MSIFKVSIFLDLLVKKIISIEITKKSNQTKIFSNAREKKS